MKYLKEIHRKMRMEMDGLTKILEHKEHPNQEAWISNHRAELSNEITRLGNYIEGFEKALQSGF